MSSLIFSESKKKKEKKMSSTVDVTSTLRVKVLITAATDDVLFVLFTFFFQRK